MFQSKERYVTRKLSTEVPLIIQAFLWSLIDDDVANDKELDYFQIFELEVIEGGLRVIHRQEQPARSKEVFLPFTHENQKDRTIWVIDSGYQTMLFPEEY